MPSTSVSRIIAAPRQAVWEALSHIENAGRWNVHWKQIEITSAGREGEGTTFRAHTDEGHVFDFLVSGWQPPEYIAFSPIADEESEAYWMTLDRQAFVLQSLDEGRTRVELMASATGHGARGFLLGLFLWRGFQKRGLNSALESLQAMFESKGLEADGKAGNSSVD